MVNSEPIQVDDLKYRIIIWDNHMQIGCEFHEITEWFNYGDRRILEMGGKEALEWWRQWKEPLKLICKNNGRGSEEE